jgi:hypothetical protein
MRYRSIGRSQWLPEFHGIYADALGIAFRQADSGNQLFTLVAQRGDLLISCAQRFGVGALLCLTRRYLAAFRLILGGDRNLDVEAVFFEGLAVKTRARRHRENVKRRFGRGSVYGINEVLPHGQANLFFNGRAWHRLILF